MIGRRLQSVAKVVSIVSVAKFHCTDATNLSETSRETLVSVEFM